MFSPHGVITAAVSAWGIKRGAWCAAARGLAHTAGVHPSTHTRGPASLQTQNLTTPLQHCVYDRSSGTTIKTAKFTPHNYYNTRGQLNQPFGKSDAYAFDFLSGAQGCFCLSPSVFCVRGGGQGAAEPAFRQVRRLRL